MSDGLRRFTACRCCAAGGAVCPADDSLYSGTQGTEAASAGQTGARDAPPALAAMPARFEALVVAGVLAVGIRVEVRTPSIPIDL